MRSQDNYWVRRLQTGSVSRRRFVGGAALAGVGAAGLGLVGCGGSSTTSTPTAASGSAAAGTSPTAKTETPKKGGSYTAAFVGPFAGADPHNSVYGGAGIVPVVYSYLFRNYEAYAPDKGNIYQLAESHKLESDSVTVVFKIRAGVKIAPNSQNIPERNMDSEDVLKSWERIANPKSGSNGYGFASKWIDKMDTPDASTFRMVLKKPYAWTDAQVGNNLQGAIVPKEGLASPDLKSKPVGSGPFMLQELTEGSQAVMVRNPNYYKGPGQPYLDKYTIRGFADQTTWLTAFSSGQADFYVALNQDEAKQLVANQKNVHAEKRPGVGFNSFWMNTKQAPWQDDRVRRAVNLATNRDEYIQIDGHGAGEPAGPVQYCYTGYNIPKDELNKLQPFNVGEAKKLFEAAGIKEFSFSHPTGGSAANYVPIFVRQMQAAGVTAKPLPLDPGTWVAGYYTSKLGASLSLNQAYNTPDNAMAWYTTEGITGNHNYDTGFSDAAVDAAILKAAGTLDVPARKAAYLEAQKLLLTKSPAFFNFYGPQTDELLQPEVRGVELRISTLGTALADSWWTTKA